MIDVHRTGLGVVVTVRGRDAGETRLWWDPASGVDGLAAQGLVRVYASAVDAAIRECLEATDGPGMAVERLNGSPRIPEVGKTGAEGGLVISVRRIVKPGVAEVTVRDGDMVPVPFYWRYLERARVGVSWWGSIGFASR